jgi:hypothetical protein
MSSASDPVIDTVLDELGYVGEHARRQAREALEEAGLTNPRKTRIASSKLDAVHEVLGRRFVLLCTRSTCRQAAVIRGRRILDTARPTDCSVCAGSANTFDVERAITALTGQGLHRVVIVGGSPSTREELQELVAGRLELRLVSGSERRTARDARADLRWADLVAIWGGTELDHRVSMLYTQGPGGRVVTCPRRGIAAMAATLITAAQGGRSPRRPPAAAP